MIESTQQLKNNTISWPDVYIAAEAEHEPFTNLTVVTAKSELLITARSSALLQLIEKNKPTSPEAIDKLAQHLVDTQQVQVREHAYIKADSTFVCMDVDKIDDESTWQALNVVYEAISNGGIWAASQPIQYKWADLI